MAATVIELFNSRTQQSATDKGIVEFRYIVMNGTDESDVNSAVAAAAPVTYTSPLYNVALWRKSIDITDQINNSTWKVTVRYETPTRLDTLITQTSFDTTGGTQHITGSFGRTAYGTNAPDGRAIAVGMTPAFITRDAGEDRMTAGTVAGDTALSAGGFGAEIVWEETVSDPTVAHWAFVRLPAAEPSSGGATPLRAQIKGIYGDYLQVALWNPDLNSGNGAFDTDTAKWVLAARPWILRMSVTSRGGESYTFNGTQTRTAVKSGYANETQKITPDYVVGDEIRVSDVDSTGVVVAAMELTREDTNSTGRKWAQSQ